MKKMIETTLPLQTLSQSAMEDKVHKGHPGNLHLWWNRSPINSSAAVLKSVLEDDCSEESINDPKRQSLLEELKQIATGDIPKGNEGESTYPIICDPFSGFGGLTIAAQKIGMNVVAGDLNSVACLLTKAATEIPANFVDVKPVNPDAECKTFFAAGGLASDIEYYGHMLRNIIYKKLGKGYPLIKVPGSDDETPAYAWIWVRTMTCPNPACGCQMPLANSYVLSKAKGHEFWAEPEVLDKGIRFKIHKGLCPKGKETNKFGNLGSKFQCPACGEITKDEQVKKAGIGGELNFQLMAVCLQTSEGKIFLEPDAQQKEAAESKMPEEIPIGSLPDNTRWFSPPGFGEKEFTDLYTPRQLNLLTTLCDVIPTIVNQVTEDAIVAGMKNDDCSLANGGKGALAYGQAIGVYLALTIGKISNFQSSVCTWDERNGNVRAAFTRQAIPMTWVFAEGNPFSTVTGNYDTMLQNVVQAVCGLKINGSVEVEQEDATKLRFPKESILFTELPYYDNVGYADLSDYFYIWLRRSLRKIYPQLFEKVVTSKEELSSIAEHYGGDTVKAIESYRCGIRTMLRNFYDASSDEYPSIIFYEYSKKDDIVICSNSSLNELSPLEFILESMIQEGFAVTGIWPVRTEKENSKYDSIRIAIVFRKNIDKISGTTRRNFINIMKREMPKSLALAFSGGIDDEDKPIAGLGSGLSIFTRFEKVMNADGSNMNIRDALRLIHQEIVDYNNGCDENACTEEE